MAAADSYVIRGARENDQPMLLALLEQHFFPREYLLSTFFEKNEHKIDEVEKKKIDFDVRNLYTRVLAKHSSVIAIHHESKKIVGISLMVVEENPKFIRVANAENKNLGGKSIPKRSKLLAKFSTDVFHPILHSIDLFTEFPSQRKALDLLLLCVDPEHCGYGLATRLMKETIKFAESKGIGLIHGLFTSPASQKAAENNGFKKFRNVDLSNIRDNDGTVIFQGKESYTVSVMVKEI